VIARIKGWAVAIAAALAILTGAYFKGRSDKAADSAKERLRDIQKARKIENETSRLSDSDVDDRLSKWMRDR
jgi:hypothetical protein